MSNNNAIAKWWADNPMTYGDTHGRTDYQDGDKELGTKEFFERLDQEFYSWNTPLHGASKFDKIFPYEEFKGKKVLEIGCGLGTMMMNWAQHGAICTGVDLNITSINQSRRRFELLGLQADIQQADANTLAFPDNSFDYVYSWGVLHHSPNLELSLKEMFRVLKPGGKFGLMLYNRQSLYQAYFIDWIEGFLHEEHRHLDRLTLCSRYGDGHREEGNPHTWPITAKEGFDMLRPYAPNSSVKVLGTELDIVLRLMVPGFSKFIPLPLRKALARRWGWSLWFSGQKSEG
jgi:ubiquinone/menaquinone biosynthesis C-methylase UbiE